MLLIADSRDGREIPLRIISLHQNLNNNFRNDKVIAAD